MRMFRKHQDGIWVDGSAQNFSSLEEAARYAEDSVFYGGVVLIYDGLYLTPHKLTFTHSNPKLEPVSA